MMSRGRNPPQQLPPAARTSPPQKVPSPHLSLAAPGSLKVLEALLGVGHHGTRPRFPASRADLLGGARVSCFPSTSRQDAYTCQGVSVGVAMQRRRPRLGWAWPPSSHLAVLRHVLHCLRSGRAGKGHWAAGMHELWHMAMSIASPHPSSRQPPHRTPANLQHAQRLVHIAPHRKVVDGHVLHHALICAKVWTGWSANRASHPLKGRLQGVGYPCAHKVGRRQRTTLAMGQAPGAPSHATPKCSPQG